DRVDVRGDVPRRLVRGRPVPEQVRREHVMVAERPRQLLEVAAVAGHALQADHPRRGVVAPRMGRKPHSCSCRGSSASRTISVRRSPEILTSDQITVPSLSMRNVPRWGMPCSSSKTPYAREAAPCGQKSDANVYVAPICFFQAWRAGHGSQETSTTS